MQHQIDMFKEPEPPRQKRNLSESQIWERKQAEYKRYISSYAWRKKRSIFIKLKGGDCERCGYGHNLELHHRHYDTLGKERLRDLELVCSNCHALADIERAARGRRRSEDALCSAMYDGRFFSYLATKYECEDMARELIHDYSEREEFEEWCEQKKEEGYG